MTKARLIKMMTKVRLMLTRVRLAKVLRGCCVAALLLTLWGSVAAAPRPSPLAEYRQRVHAALSPLDELAALCAKVAEGERYENWSKPGWNHDLPLTLPGTQERTLREVRRLLPVKEQVEWGGAVVEADNGWLHRALEEYEREDASSSATNAGRAATLREISERLRALEARLVESEKGGGGVARDKDAEKGRLTNILSHPDYNRKASEGGALQRIIEQLFQWIRDLIPSFGPIAPGASPRVSRAAQIFVLALCLGVIAIIVWKYWWRRRALGIRAISLREPRVVLGERLAPDQTAADLLADAERLARTGDLRGAIRKAYVALLCELGDRRVIRLAQHKTNRDYLQAIRASAPPHLYTEMLPLTFNFELHWYGSQAAEEGDWKDFHQRCRQLLKGL